MNHVAIDLGGRESQVCIRSSDATIIRQFKHPTKRLGALMKSWEPCRVIVETSAEAFGVADQAIAANHEVRVVPATLVKTLGVGARGIKTDQRDAQVLSQVSCQIDLPSVHVPSAQARELKSICGSRELLVATRTTLINCVRGWMRTQLWRVRGGGTSTFVSRIRARSEADGRVLPEHIDRMLLALEELNKHILSADRQLKLFAKNNEVCRRLMSVPGVGPMTAVRFLAAIDEPSRFRNAHKIAAYLGLTPGENSSSERQQRTGITKAGPRQARRLLVQAAWSALRTQPLDPMVRWATQIGQRRGKFIAVVALARKISGVLFAIWRDQTTYRRAPDPMEASV